MSLLGTYRSDGKESSQVSHEVPTTTPHLAVALDVLNLGLVLVEEVLGVVRNALDDRGLATGEEGDLDAARTTIQADRHSEARVVVLAVRSRMWRRPTNSRRCRMYDPET